MAEEKVFPSWRYHKSEPAVVVNSEEEEQALGKGWADSPAAFEEKKSAKADTPVGATSDSPAPEAGPMVEAPQAEEAKPAKSSKSKKD